MKDIHPLPFFEPEVVLYHADCPDGFGAAWAVWTRCPTARFVTARHGQPPPDGPAGKRLVIVDFSADYPFCLVWYECEGRRYVSLRSRAGGVDVSRIAQAHGGGGQRHAASFSMPIVEGQPIPFVTAARRIE
jgi:hypothetical protein